MSARYSGISANILDAIGDTPLVEVDGVFAKLEFLNPSGSIKARIAKYMLERAEREGLLLAGDTVVEATSGNTGNALALVAAVKGYRMLVVMPEGMSSERVAISRAYGAEVLFCGRFYVNDALQKARELGALPGYFCPHQFESEWNVEENRLLLGPEILGQLPASVLPDALVMGVGTGGTLLCGEIAQHQIEGISDGFVPGIFARHQDLVDQVLTVSSAEAVQAMRDLARQHGLFCGPSSGAHFLAAKRIRENHPELNTVVTLFCDEGEKYMNEYFMRADSLPMDATYFA